MKRDTNLLGNMGLALGASRIDSGDSVLNISPLVLFTVDPIQPTLKLVGSGATSEVSQNISVQIIRNNQAASNNTLITLDRGCYEFDIQLTSRMDWTAIGTVPIIDVYILSPLGSGANPLISMYAVVGAQIANRKIKMLFVEDGYFLRLAYGAVGLAEHLDATVTLQVNKFF